MLGIPLGLLVANATEWTVHKYVLHRLGKRKGSFWRFHWHEHHRNANRNAFADPAYDGSVWGWNAQGKEAFALGCAAVAVAPMFPVAPVFTATLWYGAWNYYRKHKRSHQDPEWAKRTLPWHYDHHMAPDQDANWCVTRPWFDQLLGTRVPYVGTEREQQLRGSR